MDLTSAQIRQEVLAQLANGSFTSPRADFFISLHETEAICTSCWSCGWSSQILEWFPISSALENTQNVACVLETVATSPG